MSMSTRVFLVAIFVASTSAVNFNLTSPPVTNWGRWGNHQRCGFGRYAQGFQLKTEPNQYLGDDTALNAIKLFCGDPYRPDTPTIMSLEGDFGKWGKVFNCYPGVLTGFQMKVEKDKGSSADNTAANNVRFWCSSQPNTTYIQGDGMSWGDWGDQRHCNSYQGICGISTQVEPNQGSGDDTALNNLKVECCDRSKQFDEQMKRVAEERMPFKFLLNKKLNKVEGQ